MSVDYFAVSVGDAPAARAIVEGDIPEDAEKLDKERLVRTIERVVPEFVRFRTDWGAIAESEGITAEEARVQFSSIELNWDRDSYVQVVVDDYLVTVHHGYGGGDQQLTTVGKVLRVLVGEGLWIYDPQNDDMLTPEQL
jgi:hypothetical protein